MKEQVFLFKIIFEVFDRIILKEGYQSLIKKMLSITQMYSFSLLL